MNHGRRGCCVLRRGNLQVCDEWSRDRHCILQRVTTAVAPGIPSGIPTGILRVIEPMLRGPSGHYAEFVRALASRADGIFTRIEVVADPRARDFLPTLSGAVPVTAVAMPRGAAAELRAIHGSLREGHHTLVLTATAMHALGADCAALLDGDMLARLSLCVHWPLQTRRARLALHLAPRARERSLFLATTRGVGEQLHAANIDHVGVIHYPATRAQGALLRAPFRHLLMAGAARINKGLDVVAGFAELLAQRNADLPLIVQVSPKHVDHHGSREGAVVARLLAAHYRGLVADAKSPDRQEYAARYCGALVLAPYEREKFADGVSGIVLDALLHGAPVITSAGTWAAEVVERFDAGVVLRERTAEHLAAASEKVLAKWALYADNAARASDALSLEHDPRTVAKLIASHSTSHTA